MLVADERIDLARVHEDELIVAVVAMDRKGVVWIQRELKCEDALGACRRGINFDEDRVGAGPNLYLVPTVREYDRAFRLRCTRW